MVFLELDSMQRQRHVTGLCLSKKNELLSNSFRHQQPLENSAFEKKVEVKTQSKYIDTLLFFFQLYKPRRSCLIIPSILVPKILPSCHMPAGFISMPLWFFIHNKRHETSFVILPLCILRCTKLWIDRCRKNGISRLLQDSSISCRWRKHPAC